MPTTVEPNFAFGRFTHGAQPPFIGVVVEDRVMRLEDTPVGSAGLFDDWDAMVAELSEWTPKGHTEPSLPISAVHTLASIIPGQLFQSGANYRQHVAELFVAQHNERNPGQDASILRTQVEHDLDERAKHGQPYVFVGLPSSICGPQDDVVLPRRGTQHDWELELGVVIARPARNVSRAEALHYVAGYTIVNDITTRDMVFRPDIPGIGTDWLSGKSAPTFTPTGPFLVPAACVDPSKLRIRLCLNGETMQDGWTGDMVFDVARLIEYVSSITEMRPGDLLATGSPAGNGAHHGRYLRPGDILEGQITGLGRQRNRCVAA